MRNIIWLLITFMFVLTADGAPLKVAFFEQDPLMFTDESGKRAGIVYDIVELIAEDEAIEIEYVNCKWNRCLQRLRSGEIDLVPGLTETTQRKDDFVFSEREIFKSWSALYLSKHFKLDKFNSLEGRRVGVVLKGIGYPAMKQMVEAQELNIRFVYLPSYKAVFEYIKSGEIDAGVVDRFSAVKYGTSYGAVQSSLNLAPRYYKLGFSKSVAPDVIKAIENRVKAYQSSNGRKYYEIIESYLFRSSNKLVISEEVLFVLCAVLVVLIFMTMASYLKLRRKSSVIEYEEQQLEIALAASGLCRYDWNIKDDKFDVSNEWYELFGYASDNYPKDSEEMLATIAPETKGIAKNLYCNPSELSNEYYKMEISVNAPVGRKHVYTTGRVIKRDRSGNPVSFMGFTQDVTDIKRNEATLEAVTRKLTSQIELVEKANRAKSTFLANVSHDIRTPLNVILGISDMLARTITHEDTLTQVRMMRKSGQHLSELINNVLDISAIESGNIDVSNESTYLAAMIDNVISVSQGQLGGKKIKLTSNIDPNLPDFILVDQLRLKRVLHNLMGNAIKFTEDGEVNITVWRAGSSVLFSVSDTGVGISEIMLDEIFTPFVRGESSYTKKFEGSGLGLAISRMIVDALGGEVKVDSAIGKGSRFFFELPLVEGKSVENIAKKQGHKLAGKFNLHGAKVLLVDDAEPNRKLVEIYLRGFGVELDQAENGLIAYNKIKEQEYDIVLMDLQMPEMDGFTSMRKVREYELESERDPVFVVVLSAFGLKEEIDKAFEAGGNSFLTKPVRQVDLLSTMHNIMKLR